MWSANTLLSKVLYFLYVIILVLQLAVSDLMTILKVMRWWSWNSVPFFTQDMPVYGVTVSTTSRVFWSLWVETNTLFIRLKLSSRFFIVMVSLSVLSFMWMIISSMIHLNKISKLFIKWQDASIWWPIDAHDMEGFTFVFNTKISTFYCMKSVLCGLD